MRLMFMGVEPVVVHGPVITAYKVIDGKNQLVAGFNTLAEAEACAEKMRKKYPHTTFHVE